MTDTDSYSGGRRRGGGQAGGGREGPRNGSASPRTRPQDPQAGNPEQPGREGPAGRCGGRSAAALGSCAQWVGCRGAGAGGARGIKTGLVPEGPRCRGRGRTRGLGAGDPGAGVRARAGAPSGSAQRRSLPPPPAPARAGLTGRRCGRGAGLGLDRWPRPCGHAPGWSNFGASRQFGSEPQRGAGSLGGGLSLD